MNAEKLNLKSGIIVTKDFDGKKSFGKKGTRHLPKNLNISWKKIKTL